MCAGTQEAMFLCAFRGDRVRKTVCVSVRVYARGDVSVCASAGDRMRSLLICFCVCVCGRQNERSVDLFLCASARDRMRGAVCEVSVNVRLHERKLDRGKERTCE